VLCPQPTIDCIALQPCGIVRVGLRTRLRD
jgi:hypothetical protein